MSVCTWRASSLDVEPPTPIPMFVPHRFCLWKRSRMALIVQCPVEARDIERCVNGTVGCDILFSQESVITNR
jgi:hypothetical protein